MKDKTITIRISQNTADQIKELQNLDELKAWDPTVSDIVRVAISNYWEYMCLPFKKS